jgi:hypothetical protein
MASGGVPMKATPSSAQAERSVTKPQPTQAASARRRASRRRPQSRYLLLRRDRVREARVL